VSKFGSKNKNGTGGQRKESLARKESQSPFRSMGGGKGGREISQFEGTEVTASLGKKEGKKR